MIFWHNRFSGPGEGQADLAIMLTWSKFDLN